MIMDAATAIKETGMIGRENWPSKTYVYTENGQYYFKHADGEEEPYFQVAITDNDWQPYHKKPQITPKEPGELWFNKTTNIYAHTDLYENEEGIFLQGYDGEIDKEIVHGKNGWRLIYSHN